MQRALSLIAESGSLGLGLLGVVIATAFLIGVWFQKRRSSTSSWRSEPDCRAIIEHLSEGVYHSSLDGRQLSANPALVRLNGYENEEEMLAAVNDIGREWYVDPMRRSQFKDILSKNGFVTDFISEIYRHKTRERIWISESARVVRDPKTHAALLYEGTVREVTDTVNRFRLEEQFRTLTNQVPGGLFQLVKKKNGRYRLQYTNSRFNSIFVHRDLSPLPIPAILIRELEGKNRIRFLRGLKFSERNLSPLEFEAPVQVAGGQSKWLHISAMPKQNANEIVWHGHVSDISDRKANELEITKLAYFDPLTNLPNRRMLIQQIRESIAGCNRRSDLGAVLFIDLDNFKVLNDTHGHALGDKLLIQVAKRLTRCVSSSDVVARIGGDEFVVILNAIGNKAEQAVRRARQTASTITTAIQQPLKIAGATHFTSSSMGIVIIDGEDAGVEEILRRADIAMYEAKNRGRNDMVLFSPAIMLHHSHRNLLEQNMRSVIADGRIDLLFQPVLSEKGTIVRAEAQLNWPQPEFDNVPTERFIPMAEQSGQIHELSRLTIHSGLSTLEAWHDCQESIGIQLALNVTMRTLASVHFAPLVEDALSEMQINPRFLTLIVSVHLDAPDRDPIRRNMEKLCSSGVLFALQTTGSGFSAISTLKQLPFTEIKLDRSFIDRIETLSRDRALLRSILEMSRILGLESTVSHIQTAYQEEFLRQNGCTYFQGNRYAPALPATQFRSLLEGKASRERLESMVIHT